MDSFRAHQFTENGVATFDGSWKARTPNVASKVHLDWQLSGYYNHSDSTAPELQSTAAPILPNHVDYEPWKPSGFESSRLDYEQFLPDVSEPSRQTQDPLQYKQEDVSSGWNSSPPIASRREEVLSPCTYATSSPTSAWVSIADSSYGSLPNSSHGSGSSEEDSVLYSSDYFECSNVGTFTGDIQAQSATATASTVEGASTSKADRAEQRDRVRQDAHSKVEKRYRMNINTKIQQLKSILESSPSPGKQYRKSGAELSKRDILSLAIARLEQLEHEVRDLSSQNVELMEKVALMRSLAMDE